MTSIRTDAESPTADRAQTFIDWTRINANALMAGALVVVIALAGYWFYAKQRQIKATKAETELLTAKQSIEAGNLALARSDLERVYSKYGSTSAGIQAAMLLAQLDFDSSKPQDGIARLQKAEGESSTGGVDAMLKSLEGDGYSQMGKLADAAKAYEAAAEATPYQMDKAYQLAKAARTYQSAGDTAKAHQLWSNLADDPKSGAIASEAHVRLGELTAHPVGAAAPAPTR